MKLVFLFRISFISSLYCLDFFSFSSVGLVALTVSSCLIFSCNSDSCLFSFFFL